MHGGQPGPHGKNKMMAKLAWLRTDGVRRVLALVIAALAMALLMMDHVRLPARLYAEGEVAEWDVRANTSFPYVDWAETLERQRVAVSSVRPVYDYDATQLSRLQQRNHQAFEIGRRCHHDTVVPASPDSATPAVLSEEERSAALQGCTRQFLDALELSLGPDDLQRIVDLRWSSPLEELSSELLSVALQRYVIADQALLPEDSTALTVVRVLPDGQDEVQLNDGQVVKTPDEVRQVLSLYALERTDTSTSPEEIRAALAIARAAVRPNFSYNQLLTEERRREKRAQSPEVVVQVQRGTAIVRKGDVVTREQAEMLQALAANRDGYGTVGAYFAMVAFCGMLFVTLYSFGASTMRRFSTRPKDLEAASLIAILTVFVARLTVEMSGLLMVTTTGLGMASSALWFAVPLAGGAMLVRLLISAETALIWVLGVSAVTGMLMEQQVLFSLFFVISGVTAASMIGSSRERVQLVRAGVQTGLINAAAALLISLIHVHLGDAPVSQASTTQPLWGVGFAFLGGIVSAFFALGMVPIFEQVGFVTNFKLLELANLNHPLLRQLMLRAPGTYHHSMTVASLSEAAAEAIGANSLQTRVACYFHDIGKGLQPHFFIENQRGGPNPHDHLKPHQSAQVIINHVVDGAAIAEQHNLPQCILDGILMHHGTSLIKYFYAKALEQAEDGQTINEADFRYPGKRPSTREGGIIFLADRIEAACRTIKVPNAQNFRGMIQKLVNDAITDGQLEECPLTVKELYTIMEVFTTTLQGIHHHRIEYPLLPPRDQKAASKDTAAPSGASVITLEMANPLRTDANQD